MHNLIYSQRISKLENGLGVVLLRNQKGAKAAKAGEEFLAYSKKVLRDTETIKNKMKNNTMYFYLCSDCYLIIYLRAKKL